MLRFGNSNTAHPVPVGARIRIPNIVFDSLPTEAPLQNDVNESTLSLTFESSAAISDFSTNTSGYMIDYERGFPHHGTGGWVLF
jgi:hypothetical protein